MEDKKTKRAAKKVTVNYSPTIDGRVEILGVHITQDFTPTPEQMADEQFKVRLDYAVEIGLLNEHTK